MPPLEKRLHDPISGGFLSKLSPEVIERVDVALRAGAPIGTAATFGGISHRAFNRYLSDGRALLEQFAPEEVEDPLDLLRMRLVVVVDEAIAEFKIALTGTILQAGQNGAWQALGWLAERRFPDEFGRRQRIEHANPEGEAFRIQPTPMFDPSKLSDEELDQWIALAEKAAPDGGRPPIGMGGDLRALDA